MALFCLSFFLSNCKISVSCYDNKNNNDNSNKAWTCIHYEIVMILYTPWSSYDPVTLTKGSQFCIEKQFFKKIW